jgi:hypothetical protein
MLEFLDAGLTQEHQCVSVDAKLAGCCATSVVPFGTTGLLSVLVVVGGRAPTGAPAVFVSALSPTEISCS